MVLLVCGVPGAIYSPKRVFHGSGHSRVASLKLPLIRLILTPLDRSSFSASKKVWNSKIQQSDQKLWLSEVCDATISTSSPFLWYFGHSNFDFDPWIVVGTRIRWSSQWHWFQAVLATESKLGFLGSPKIDFGSNLVKVAKNLWEAQVWRKAMKNVVLWKFRSRLIFGQS